MQFSFSGPKTLKALLKNTQPDNMSRSKHILLCVLRGLSKKKKK